MPGQILEGIRVIDVTQFIAGSRCAQILADMGAEVVKVEPPEGDTLRMLFSLTPGAERNYSVLNRNKYGLAVDMRKPAGRQIILRLATLSDILIHNLIPGTLERLGLGYADIKSRRDEIIYAAISGFGAFGKAPERAAFDIVAQATSGQLWNSQESFRVPDNYWGDFMTGAYAAIAILLALIQRMKTGQGQYIDISMQDVMYFNNYRALMDKGLGPVMTDIERQLGRRPRDVLNSSDRMPFYGFFKAKDGKVAIVSTTTRQWKELTEIIGHAEMATDPRFDNLIAQIQNHEQAVRLIEEWTSAHTAKEVIALLEGKKIPCGIAYTLEEVNADENLRQRGMFQHVHHEQYGDIDIPGLPFKFSAAEGGIRMPAPGLGEHSRLILEQWLWYTAEEIDELYKQGAIL
jgi:crotonobetainyl-CoA:carnitine CoA-transferase CaiB-like acyl-CoA transferase